MERDDNEKRPPSACTAGVPLPQCPGGVCSATRCALPGVARQWHGSGTQRNHQPGLRYAGHAMMHQDPIAVLLCRPVEASLASPMVPLQNRLSIFAEMFLVVMLARKTPRAHASGHDLKRSAGTEENRLNSFAARLVCQVREPVHLRMLTEPDAATIFHGKWSRFYRIRGLWPVPKKAVSLQLVLVEASNCALHTKS
jgi:hypothetical protein